MRAVALLVLAPALTAAEQPLPTYTGAPSTRIGAELVIRGEPYRMAYFVTDDPLPKVAAHFEKTWSEAGYPVTTGGDFEAEAVVSAFFTRQGLVRSIVLRRHGNRTLGFSVLKDAWAKVPMGPWSLPMLEGALWAADLWARGDAESTRHRTAVLQQPLKAARDARDRAWTLAGWERVRETEVPRPGAGAQRVLEYAKGRDEAVVTLVAIDARTSALDETWLFGTGRAPKP